MQRPTWPTGRAIFEVRLDGNACNLPQSRKVQFLIISLVKSSSSTVLSSLLEIGLFKILPDIYILRFLYSVYQLSIRGKILFWIKIYSKERKTNIVKEINLTFEPISATWQHSAVNVPLFAFACLHSTACAWRAGVFLLEFPEWAHAHYDLNIVIDFYIYNNLYSLHNMKWGIFVYDSLIICHNLNCQ